VICCKQALIDFGVPGKGFDVEVISADHQNKPDVGAGIARQWIDQDGVDAIVDVPTSSVGLAVNQVCREKNKVMLKFWYRNLGPHRQAVQSEHNPLDLRHVHAGQVDRGRDGEAGR
jgi:hypothetical protein